MRKIHKDSKKELKFEKENLPKRWIKTKLENICIIIGGGTPSRQKIEYFNGDIIWLTPTEIPKYQIIRINDSREKITELGLKKSSAKIIPINSVLLTSRASIGYVAIAGTEVTTNQGFASFVCNKTTSSYFLAYWLFGNKNLLESKATGTTFKEISKSKLRELEFKLPPLNEQKRIVSKIESILVQIDASKTSLEKVQVLLKQNKQAVLKSAFEGKLVPQDPNDEPAEVLLKRIHMDSKQELVFDKENIPEGWLKTKLENLSTIILGQSPPSSTYNQEQDGLPFFQGKADFGTLYPKTRIWCNSPKKLAKQNDILISVRAPVGSLNISKETCCIGRGLSSIRPLSIIAQMYLFYQLQSLENYISQKGTGTTFKAITASQLKAVSLKLPPLNEQKRIVAKIESIFGRIDACRIVINSKTRQKLVTIIINSI